MVNYRIDDLWDMLAEAGELRYPLLPRHPDDPGACTAAAAVW